MEFGTMVIIAVVLFFLAIIMIKQINEYERGILFTMGTYTMTYGPGWRIVVPVFQSLYKVDIRTKAVDVPNQETITRDNIPININAVIYYKVVDVAKSILEVENFYYAISQLAQTTMRNMVGEYTLDQILQERQVIAKKIKEEVDRATDAWGIDVQMVELKDIVLPENLRRTIAKAAEAERERRAVIISSQGEVDAANNVAKAAGILASTPGALHLRTLQSINDISSDDSNTTVWMVPVEVLEAFKSFSSSKK